MEWVLALGIVTGLRSMTAMAVVCWFAWMGLLPQTGWTAWAATLPAVIVFTACALGEYVADVLPMIPSRKSPGPATARLVLGALAGAIGWRALNEPTAGGIILGAIGALIGTFGGYRVRMNLARRAGRDWPIGITESLFALGLAILAAHILHMALVQPPQAMLRMGLSAVAG